MKKKIEKCEYEKGKFCSCPVMCYFSYDCRAKDEFGYPIKERKEK